MPNFFKVSNRRSSTLIDDANTAYDKGICPGCGTFQSMHFMPAKDAEPDDYITCGICLASFTCEAPNDNPDAPINACLGVLPKDADLHQRYLEGDKTDKLMDKINRDQAAARQGH